MIVKVYNYENGEFLFDFKTRKNTKSVLKDVKSVMEEKYNCSIRNSMVQGKIDYANPDNTELHYILFGTNLPCRIINYVCI